MAAKNPFEKRPKAGFQMNFVSSNVDICFGAGGVGNGKSFSLVMAIADSLLTDGNFRAMISRRSLQNQKQGGGFVDEFKKIFGDGDMCHIKQSDSPRISFDCGAYCDLTYLDDTNLDKLKERAKGWQYDAIGIDELTEMPWEVFTYIQSRNRGSGRRTGKFYGTFNPKRTHWTRTFCDWYIGADGYVIPERNGVVRYFFIYGNTVNDVAWGSTKEEVYHRCSIQIDRVLDRLNAKRKQFTYEHVIKSFCLYVGDVSENDELIGNNAGYIGSVAMSGEKVSGQLLGVNFNIDPDEDEKIPIPATAANECFTNDPAVNGEMWITADLADYGTDNVVLLAWNGFHVFDMVTIAVSTPRENAIALRNFAAKHNLPHSRVIFDATAARYVLDYLPDAVPFISNTRPMGMYKDSGEILKDVCYLRLCYLIKRGQLTFDDRIARSIYQHQNQKTPITVQTEFIEECSVVRFDTTRYGRNRLWPKKKMNAMLGRGRSMDLLDPCAMRMLPCLDMEYGSELNNAAPDEDNNGNDVYGYSSASLYNETNWY